MSPAKKDAAAKADPVEEAATAEALAAFEQFAELGPGVEVQICREPGQRYLEILPLDGLDLETLRSRYGGGKFSLRARQNGRWIKGSPTRRVEIEGKEKPFPPKDDEEPAADPRELIRAELAKLLPQPGASTSETMMVAMMTTLSTVLQTVLQASLERRPETTAAEIFQLAREFARDAPSGGGGDFDPAMLLGTSLIQELRAMREGGARPAIAPPPRGDAPATNGASRREDPQVNARRPETLPELAEFMRAYCAPHAARGADPDLRAEVFVEDVALRDPDLLASITELAQLPNVLDHWQTLCPSIGEEREWHAAFIETVASLGSGGEGDAPGGGAADTAEGGPGDVGDAPGDGAARPAGGEG